MAGLKIFGGADTAPAKKTFADDIVGRFRSGYVTNNRPVALAEWRVTTGDRDVAESVQALMGGDDPQAWDAKGEDNLEVFSSAKSVDIVLESAEAIRQKMVLWGRNGAIYMSDGETIFYPEERKGEADPHAGATLAERKLAAKNGTGAEPQTEVLFRLAKDPELGIFKFQSGSWSLVSDLAYHNVPDALADLFENGAEKVAASIALEEVSFVAKNGPRAGQTVSYTKPVLTLKGAA